MVTANDKSTVFLRPILFISMPVGTLKMRNQKKTIIGKLLASESVRPRSFCTKLDAVPTRSTKPMQKKHSMTEIIAILLVFAIIFLVLKF